VLKGVQHAPPHLLADADHLKVTEGWRIQRMWWFTSLMEINQRRRKEAG
jgi:hypothetical protein